MPRKPAAPKTRTITVTVDEDNLVLHESLLGCAAKARFPE